MNRMPANVFQGMNQFGVQGVERPRAGPGEAVIGSFALNPALDMFTFDQLRAGGTNHVENVRKVSQRGGGGERRAT